MVDIKARKTFGRLIFQNLLTLQSRMNIMRSFGAQFYDCEISINV
ncbi:hypothetical protein R6Q57_018595 [Mikania cordata]